MEFNDLIENAIYYSLSDIGEDGGAVPILKARASEMNELNYGIFWTLNEFKQSIRRKENLKKINCWAIDIDEGTKLDQMTKIVRSPLSPSMIVETKRGYQCYWFAKDASVENYSAIVEHRLIPFFWADIRAKDVCRILRVPGFMHCKDPNDKFLVKLVETTNLIYSEDEMMTFFRAVIRPLRQPNQEMKRARANGFWEEKASIPVEEALRKLSGRKELKHEHFSFSPNNNGTVQIVVNGRKTSSWIDRDGMIGSYDRGGPTISQWIFWYLKDYKKVYELLAEVFGEGEKNG